MAIDIKGAILLTSDKSYCRDYSTSSGRSFVTVFFHESVTDPQSSLYTSTAIHASTIYSRCASNAATLQMKPAKHRTPQERQAWAAALSWFRQSKQQTEWRGKRIPAQAVPYGTKKGRYALLKPAICTIALANVRVGYCISANYGFCTILLAQQ